jgi:hypothetical protein
MGAGAAQAGAPAAHVLDAPAAGAEGVRSSFLAPGQAEQDGEGTAEEPVEDGPAGAQGADEVIEAVAVHGRPPVATRTRSTI